MYSTKKLFFLGFLLLLLNVAQAQTEKKQIMLVPYTPVHFLSTFDLAEIANYNFIDDPADVHQHFLDSLMKAMAKEHPQYSVFQIPQNDWQAIQYSAQVRYQDYPIGHYGVDIKQLMNNSSFEQLLENLGADYILFVSHYMIEKKLHSSSRSFDGSYIIPWARHLVDYELYNKEGKMVAMADRLELEGNQPTSENYLQKGLVLKNMQGSFRSLLKDIIQKEKRYKNKPVYKYRKKKTK